MKRILSVLLAGFIVCGVVLPCAYSETGPTSEADGYKLALSDLNYHMTHVQWPDVKEMERILKEFETLGNYEWARSYVIFVQALIDVERNDWQAVERACKRLDTIGFDSHLLDSGEMPNGTTAAALTIYWKARKAENEGNINEAMGMLEQIPLFYDAMIRSDALSFDIPTHITTPSPKPTSVPKRNVRVGESITLGYYEQDDNTYNGKEDIQWYIVTIQGQRALLLSKHVLDAKPINDYEQNVSWSESTLRTWLNGTFLNTAFSTAERSSLIEQTKNLVFVMSKDEIDRYLNANQKLATATPYAIAQGAYSDMESGMSWWWTRTRDPKAFYFLGTNSKGNITGFYVTRSSGGVRPAVWVDLSKLPQ